MDEINKNNDNEINKVEESSVDEKIIDPKIAEAENEKEVNQKLKERKEEKRKRRNKDIRESCMIIVICIIIYFIIQTFFVQLIKTDQLSMYPTIGQDEIWLVNKWAWITEHHLERGDIIVFQEPSVLFYDDNTYDEENIIAKYDGNLLKDSMAKRVIALPGEHIYIKDDSVYVNGIKLEEPYLYAQNTPLDKSVRNCYFLDLTVPDDCVFVMGDNRSRSDDSRNYGCIPFSRIQGFMEKKLYPINEEYSKAEIAELVSKNIDTDNYKMEKTVIPLTIGESAKKYEITNDGNKKQIVTYNLLDERQEYSYEDGHTSKRYDTNSQVVTEINRGESSFLDNTQTLRKEYSSYLRRVFEDGYTYRYVGEEKLNGEICIACDFVADEDITLENDTYRYWIRKSDGIIVKIKDADVVNFYDVELNRVTDQDFRYKTDTSNYYKIKY